MSTTVAPPDGATFTYDEVKTAKGTQSLGEHPLLVWNDLDKARAYYTDEGIKDILDGTSLRVSFQSIARRMTIAKKSDDEIAKAQVDFRPGKRAEGVSTPVSRARRAGAAAAEKLGEKGDLVSALLERIAKGEISMGDIEVLAAK